MTIFDKITVGGSTITNNFNIKLRNSVSINNSSSTFEVEIDNFNGKNASTQNIGDEVVIFADKDINPPTTKIFTGIFENRKFPSKGLKEKVIYSGRDFSARLMERTVEPEVYSNLLAGSIVKDIIAKYTDDITTTNVDDSTKTISRIAFTQKPVYDAIKELAELANFTFFVDENKDLNFKLKSETSSGKTFSSGNVISANIKEKRDTVFNEIWVYGDRYLDSFREEFTAGSPLGGSVFTLINRPHNTIIDAGSPITQSTRQKGGILGMNIVPPSGTDYLVDFFDKQIVFISGTSIGYDSIPSSGTLVTVDYQRSLPIVKVGQNAASIASFGKRIKVITDSEIKDPATAQEILDKELEENSLPKKQGIIKVDGLATVTAGQTAIVDLPNQNISNQTYEILEVKHDFNKENNLTEQVLTLKVNKKIDDVTDTIKDLINDVREIRASSLNVSDVLTRFQFTTGSFGLRTSGLSASTRLNNDSFIVGHPFNGVLGLVNPSTVGSVGDGLIWTSGNWSEGYSGTSSFALKNTGSATADFVKIPSSPMFNLHNTNMFGISIMANFLNELPEFRHVISKSIGGNHEWALRISSGAVIGSVSPIILFFGSPDATQSVSASFGPVKLNEWNHYFMIGSFSNPGVTAYAYLNGSLIDSGVKPNYTQILGPGSTEPVKFFKRGNESTVPAIIDDIRFYNGMLSNGEIGSLAEKKAVNHNLVAYYKLDEGTGSFAYNSASVEMPTKDAVAHWRFNQSGTVMNDETQSFSGVGVNSPGIVDGVYNNGSSLFFNGSGARFDIQISGNAKVSSDNPFAYSCWVNWKGPSNSPSGTEGVFMGHRWGDNATFSVLGNGTINLRTNDTQLITSQTIGSNQWTYLVGQSTGSQTDFESKIYINGSLVKSGNAFDEFPAPNSLIIGTDLRFGRHFFGNVDEVRVYNKELTQSEIQELYEGKTIQPLLGDRRSTFTTNFSGGYPV